MTQRVFGMCEGACIWNLETVPRAGWYETTWAPATVDQRTPCSWVNGRAEDAVWPYRLVTMCR
jgi:hypothetical protein